MRMRHCLCHLAAASRAHKRLIILVLASLCSLELGLLQFVWVAVPSTTELTSINGLKTISPEGGP